MPSGARLTDDEAVFLRTSGGKYTREETFTDTFTDEIGIRRGYSYRDDDGQTGGHSTFINDTRGILSMFKVRR